MEKEEDLETKVKNWMSKSAKASKKVLEKAGDKVQDFTDRSVIKMEKRQLESKLEYKYMQIGKKISDILINDNSLNISNDEDKKVIDSLMSDIQTIRSEIVEKEKELN